MRSTCALLLVLWAGFAIADEPKVRITLEHPPGSAARFELHGLAADSLRDRQPAEWQAVFAIYAEESDRPAMLGTYSVEQNVLRFQPRFPLQPGVTYVAVYKSSKSAESLRREFRMPERQPERPPIVTVVYPTRNVLPENLLKFYLHFSVPMSQGDSYRHIHLLRANGEAVELPFLELGEELWDATGTRLTVFFDPGRIKRGLKPREEVGPSLEEGQRYVLLIDDEWTDATGHRLLQPYRKRFRVVEPDLEQPNPQRWEIFPPAAGSKELLVVRFDEPLDHALLQHLVVRPVNGQPIEGRISTSFEETQWRFRPGQPWPAGNFEIVVETTLEDLAGNSIGRPFEVDVQRPIERQIATETVTVPFAVK